MAKRVLGFALMAALTIVLVGVGSTRAVADPLEWTFTLTIADPGGGGDALSGTLVLGTYNGNGMYVISSIMNGLDNGESISLLPPDSIFVVGTPNDNVFNTLGNLSGTPPWFDTGGFAVIVTSGLDRGNEYDFFYDPNPPPGSEGPYAGCTITLQVNGCESPETFQAVTNISFQPASTPEPSSMLLFGTGALGVLASVRRKLRV
jgi:hypothetical protein